jgi:hypothetical protein
MEKINKFYNNQHYQSVLRRKQKIALMLKIVNKCNKKIKDEDDKLFLHYIIGHYNKKLKNCEVTK